MERAIMKDPIFLAQESAAATPDDLPVAQDLLDTLAAYRDGCVGMAANMIGISKRMIAFDHDGKYMVMFNPEIVKCSGPYEAYENDPGIMREAMRLGWTQNPVLLDADLTQEECSWYIRAALRFGWSKKSSLTKSLSRRLRISPSTLRRMYVMMPTGWKTQASAQAGRYSWS